MSDAAEILEVHGQAEANQRLRDGWKLLAVLPAVSTGGLVATPYGIYVMGKPAQKKDPMEGFEIGKHATQP